MDRNSAPVMDWSCTNQLDSYKLFEQRIKLFFTARRITDPEHKVANILLQLGEEGLKRYNALTLTEQEQKEPDTILKKIREQLEPAENFRVSRLRLMTLRQLPSESLDTFVNKAKELAKACDFCEGELDERIIELIIAGTPDDDFRKDLLSKKKGFTLQETLTLGRQYEATAAHVKELKNMASTTVDALRSKGTSCRNCGTSHGFKNCPAFGTKCTACDK